MTKNVTVQKLIAILLHRIKFIIIVSFAAGLLAFLYSSFIVTPQYNTSTMIFVQNYNRSNSQNKVSDDIQDATNSADNSGSGSNNNEIAGKIFSSDISGSAQLAKTCVTLFNNSDKITSIYNGCDVVISVTDETFYITISVSGDDPENCANVANQIADMCAEVFHERFGYGQIGTIRTAQVPSAPSSPNKFRFTIIGFAVGLIAACVVSILLELIDTTIKPDDDLFELYKIPVFAEIPDFENQGR